MSKSCRLCIYALILVTMLSAPFVAHAHVKWFSDFSFEDQPRQLRDVVTPTFLALTALSFVTIGALVLIDRRLSTLAWYQNLNARLESYSTNSTLVMRIALGATLLLSWEANTLLVPYLNIESEPILGWLQFALVLLLIFPATTPIAGLGVLVLYIVGINRFGAFYMLDYLLFIGVGYFLLVSRLQDRRLRATGLPALYLTVGFSLCWVGLEKFIYPQWGLYVLEQNPQLTLGLNSQFFLMSAGFIEFSLGYLLIICLLERPISLVVTLVFFTTTLVFGRVEVIGHTIIHGALIVFIIEGPGKVYLPPALFHRKLNWRVAFSAVNFVLLLIILFIPYYLLANQTYTNATGQAVSQQIEPE